VKFLTEQTQRAQKEKERKVDLYSAYRQ